MSKDIDSILEKSKRRRKVYAMYVQGYSQAEIAEKEEIHRNTVSKDIKFMKEEAKKLTTEDAVKERLDGTIRELDYIVERAWQDYNGTEVKSVRVQIINLIVRVKREIVDILQSTGIMPKAAAKMDLSAEVKRIGQMTESELEGELILLNKELGVDEQDPFSRGKMN